MSSSGLVPTPSSKREENEYWPSKAPPPSRIEPFPSFRPPSQRASDVRAGMIRPPRGRLLSRPSGRSPYRRRLRIAGAFRPDEDSFGGVNSRCVCRSVPGAPVRVVAMTTALLTGSKHRTAPLGGALRGRADDLVVAGSRQDVAALAARLPQRSVTTYVQLLMEA